MNYDLTFGVFIPLQQYVHDCVIVKASRHMNDEKSGFVRFLIELNNSFYSNLD